MNKKGMSIGLSLSYILILGGVIILLLILYLGTGWIIQSQKTFFLFGGEENEISSIESHSNKMENFRVFERILELRIGENKTEDLIIDWWKTEDKELKRSIEEHAGDFLESNFNSSVCYFFKVDSPDTGGFVDLNKYLWVARGFQETTDRGSGVGPMEIQDSVSILETFSGDANIRWRFYSGKC